MEKGVEGRNREEVDTQKVAAGREKDGPRKENWRRRTPSMNGGEKERGGAMQKIWGAVGVK